MSEMTRRGIIKATGAGLASVGLSELGVTSEQMNGFASIELQAPDLTKLATFYGDTLNLKTEKNNKGMVVQAGGTRLNFTQADSKSKPIYHFAFNIPENKLEEAMAWLKKRTPLISQN